MDAHVADTLAAGAGMCDPDAVYSIVADGYRAVAELVGDGARFDESVPGQWALTREGGHSRRRIIHAGGDATGAEVQRALDHAAADAGHPPQPRRAASAARRSGGHRGVWCATRTAAASSARPR